MADVRGAGMLIGDVLNQRAAEGDIDDLDAATDAEDGDTKLDRGGKEIDFELVPFGIDTIRFWVNRGVAVPLWRDVGASAEQNAVHVCTSAFGGIDLRRQDHRQRRQRARRPARTARSGSSGETCHGRSVSICPMARYQ